MGALHDPTRRSILLDFYDHPAAAQTVDEVADRAGIHRSVAFTHLQLLVSLGYLTVSKRRGRFGNPANLYRLTGGRIELGYPARQFAQLATLLATSLKELGSAGMNAAHRVGRRFGASLPNAAASSVQDALHGLGLLGGDYRLVSSDGDYIDARSCIFREACTTAHDVVCQLHAGMLEGVLEQAGFVRKLQPLGADGGGGCRYRFTEAS